MKISKKWKIGLFLVCSIVLCKRYAYTIHAEETGPDSYTETSAVNIQKQDENNQPVSGADLQIIDQNNQVKEAWTTDGTTHETSLEPGTYTLHEQQAPTGYETSDDITFTVTAPQLENRTGLIGYQYSVVHGDWSYRVRTTNQDLADGKIVYCLNEHRTYPHDNTYTELDATSELFTQYIATNITNMQAFQENLKRVLYYGYGSDALGLQKTYNMSNLAFRRVTQVAVWYYTDSQITNIPDTPGSHGSYMIYHVLVDSDLAVPNSIQLKFYRTDDSYYQNLIGFVRYVPLTITMTDKQKITPVTPNVPTSPTVSHTIQPKDTYEQSTYGVQTGTSQSSVPYLFLSVIALLGFVAIIKQKESFD